VEKQQALGWGESVVEQVAMDLQAAFPGIDRLLTRNVWRCKQFYLAYCDPEFLSQLVAKFAAVR
jgi:hypothetical protein